ncbi:MAG: nucleoside 2-deoxyribosyltransferase [Deltaproteobacteria bacterium]|nr:nucleoside 2-deoxyribosyltransferase [Deltaproteobacteria bacterium]
MTHSKKIRVYCSGPLFSPEERAAMASISEALEKAGFETFLPQRDGLEYWVMGLANTPVALPGVTGLVHRAIFAVDVFQIFEGCDALVFNMNGRVPDEGAVAETAMAFTAGKPLVIYKNDDRTVFGGHDNSMVSGLSVSFSKVRNVEEIPSEVALAMKKSPPSPYSDGNIPRGVQGVISQGRQVDRLLRAAKYARPNVESLLKHIEKIYS